MKKLQNSGLHYTIVPIYYALGNIFMQPLLAYLFVSPDQTSTKIAGYDNILILSIIAIGLNNYISNIFFTLAYSYTDPTTISVVFFIGMPITFVQDILIFGNSPKTMEIVGASMILLANLQMAMHELKGKKD